MNHLIRNILLALAALLVVQTPARADRPAAGEIQIVAYGWSQHFSTDPGIDYSEVHPTFGVEYTVESDGWRTLFTAVTLNDSHGRRAWYAGVGSMHALAEGRGWSLEGGVYGVVLKHSTFKNGEATIGAAPVLTINAGDVAFNVTYLPRLEGSKSAVGLVQIKLGF